ncbi:hypothetical protein DVH05_014861 [Phytophthora capsici]|nr:hypothetical protein DVH05_014861 [Phytophthora capsici]
MLCRQNCGFKSPCCHKANYSMLPECYKDSDDSDDDSLKINLSIDQVEPLDKLYRRGVEFCYHRQDIAEFYHFLTSTFYENVDKVLWLFVPKIVIEERRATLLLRYLSKNPDTHTHCCKLQVCFKCKVTNHHNGNCKDFTEEKDVVECRGCGATVVKVLLCLCGYSISWDEEVARQYAQRKLLAPTEDKEYDDWSRWHKKMRQTREKVISFPVAQFVHEHRALLRRRLPPRLYRRRQLKKDALAENAMES